MFFKASDDELMDRIAKGDQGAFRSLFDRHGARVLGYCRRFMGDAARGEDMSQATWMKVVKSSALYKAEGKFLSWLLLIAKNACVSEMRLASERFESPASDEGNASEALASRDDFEKDLMEQQTLDELKERIEELPESQRVVLTLWMANELSYEKIAEDLKISEASVKSLLFRARRSLEKAMRAKYETI